MRQPYIRGWKLVVIVLFYGAAFTLDMVFFAFDLAHGLPWLAAMSAIYALLMIRFLYQMVHL